MGAVSAGVLLLLTLVSPVQAGTGTDVGLERTAEAGPAGATPTWMAPVPVGVPGGEVVSPGAIPAAVIPLCTLVEDPDYYRIPLATTRLVAGTGQTTGEAGLGFPAASPFGIAVTPDGSYDYRVRFDVRRLPARSRGVFVAWVTTPEIDRVRRIGPLDGGRAEGPVEWNKFLVVVTMEPHDSPTAAPVDEALEGMDAPGGVAGSSPPWTGPVVLRGMSRSGRMHTMAGHGPFEQERCAKYGFS